VRARRAVGLLTAVAALVSGLAAGPAGTALANPSVASATAQAKALAAQVAALQIQVEVATEQYDAVQEKLGQVVTSYLDAQQQLGSLTDDAAQQRAQNVARIQALYKSGGQLGLFAQILDGSDISDVISRYVAVNHVLAADANAITDTAGRVNRASLAATALNGLADQKTALESQAQLARARVIGLLGERQGQLDSANALVRRLVAAEQARAAAAAAAAAAVTLNTDPFPPTVLPVGTPAAVVTAIAAARSVLGDPYQWGATGPTTWDCSGLTQWAYSQAGVTLPRTSREQWFSGTHPTLSALAPGDLMFWATNSADPASIHHVAIYLGGGYMIEAPHTGAFVQIVPVYLDGYFGATRPVA
jgi:peptidoglycan DL-endopeptidase CwlO